MLLAEGRAVNGPIGRGERPAWRIEVPIHRCQHAAFVAERAYPPESR